MIARGFGDRGTDTAEKIRPGLEGVKADVRVKYKSSKSSKFFKNGIFRMLPGMRQ
jgi:hypothetical protein